MNTIQARGKLIAGVAFDIAGMGYKNPHTGEIEGFEADLARAIAAELFGDPNQIEFVQVLPDQRISTLQQDKADMVISQITITSDRTEQVDFSLPYYTANEGIIVLKGSAIKTFEDLKGKRVAVPAGSISLRRLRAKLPEATLIVTPLESEGIEAVAKGEADAASNDYINLTMMQKHSANPAQFEIIDISADFEPKPFGIAVKKGNQDLVNFLNATINKFAANGRINDLLTKNIL